MDDEETKLRPACRTSPGGELDLELEVVEGPGGCAVCHSPDYAAGLVCPACWASFDFRRCRFGPAAKP